MQESQEREEQNLGGDDPGPGDLNGGVQHMQQDQKTGADQADAKGIGPPAEHPSQQVSPPTGHCPTRD